MDAGRSGAMMLSHGESDNEADLLTGAFSLVWIFEKSSWQFFNRCQVLVGSDS